MASRCITRSCSQVATPTPFSAARAFLQLAPQRYIRTSSPVLDFLLPSAPYHTRSRAAHVRLSSQKEITTRRAFTSSSKRQATTAIFNPRDDDDGNPMQIEITPRASNRLKEIMSKDSNPNLALRISVESGGCHGFQYLMSLTTLPPFNSSSLQEESSPASNTSSSNSEAMPPSSPTDPEGKKEKLDEDDTVFAADDGSGPKVVMDGPSLEVLKGSKVDYTMELIGSQFKIVDNPLATSSCGCGTSFDIKA
ncbi:[4Fe-4S] proteins maturation [Cadophora gregata]|uniref:[4Fe-4S] proteins maturation n=1 Tax=Cadophora gregata TaxID=51156 RepID=UPI0026DAF14A|nr:[4Fe-4S] proteins maturation [Cadophora gregata]KAK0100087.1 [4Fe-4S] proteins maturation [Cadophora gregata f. sp. sojae]KAK0116069.1 [4Fe-4S] proteins maturation [Cadophora gregata]